MGKALRSAQHTHTHTHTHSQPADPSLPFPPRCAALGEAKGVAKRRRLFDNQSQTPCQRPGPLPLGPPTAVELEAAQMSSDLPIQSYRTLSPLRHRRQRAGWCRWGLSWLWTGCSVRPESWNFGQTLDGSPRVSGAWRAESLGSKLKVRGGHMTPSADRSRPLRGLPTNDMAGISWLLVGPALITLLSFHKPPTPCSFWGVYSRLQIVSQPDSGL